MLDGTPPQLEIISKEAGKQKYRWLRTNISNKMFEVLPQRMYTCSHLPVNLGMASFSRIVGRLFSLGSSGRTLIRTLPMCLPAVMYLGKDNEDKETIWI